MTSGLETEEWEGMEKQKNNRYEWERGKKEK